METEFEELKTLIENLEDKVASDDYDEKTEIEYYEVETKLEEFEANNWEERDLSQLKSRMKVVKEELDLYDQEAELGMMFPNRHDEDFDEDAMSGESFFKD